MSDRLLGGFLFVVALAFVVGATQIEAGLIFDPIGPQGFPIAIGVALALSCIYPIVRPDREPDWPRPRRLFEIALVLAAMVGYALILTPMGFVASTALAAAFISWRLGARPVIAVPVGGAIAVGIYVTFHLILGLSLAKGPWGF